MSAFVTLFMIIAIIMVVLRIFTGQTGRYNNGGMHQLQNQQNQVFEDIQREARLSRHLREQRRLLAESQPKEPVDESLAMQRKIGEEIDKIAAQPGGLMQFDLNGDGLVDNEEMKVARARIASELKAAAAELSIDLDDEDDIKHSW